MPPDALNAPLTLDAPLCPATSTTARDIIEVKQAAATLSRRYRVSETVNMPGGREAPYRNLLLSPIRPRKGLLSFMVDRSPLGLDGLAMMPDGNAMAERMDSLGTFNTMAEAMDAVATSLREHKGAGFTAAG